MINDRNDNDNSDDDEIMNQIELSKMSIDIEDESD